MTKLYCSQNSEFFAAREPGRLHLYKQSFRDITHVMNDKMAGDLIHLANNGDSFFRSSDGLFRLRREKNVRAERCKAVRDLDGSPEGGTLQGFYVQDDGERVAFEQVLPAQKFSSKLRRFLGKKSSQADVGPRLHRFILSQWSGRGATCYYETIVDPRTSAGLFWWASPEFGYLAILERRRDGNSILRLIDVETRTLISELALSGRLARDRFLTSRGSVGFGLERDGSRVFVIWTYEEKRFGVSYPKDSRVIHLGKDLVVFQSRKNETLLVKNYENQLLLEVSLKCLTDLGVQYKMSFNPRGSLDLVTHSNGELRIHYTDLESLPIDVRRWELLKERQQAQSLEFQSERIVESYEENRELSEHRERRAELGAEITELQAVRASGDVPSVAERPQRPEALVMESMSSPVDSGPASEQLPEIGFADRQEAEEALERLRMRYIAGELTREDYYNEKTLIERAFKALPEV